MRRPNTQPTAQTTQQSDQHPHEVPPTFVLVAARSTPDTQPRQSMPRNLSRVNSETQYRVKRIQFPDAAQNVNDNAAYKPASEPSYSNVDAPSPSSRSNVRIRYPN